MVTVECNMQINWAETTMLYISTITMTQISRSNTSTSELQFSMTYENDISHKDQLQHLEDKMDTCERKVQVSCGGGCVEAIQIFTSTGEMGSEVDMWDNACLCER